MAEPSSTTNGTCDVCLSNGDIEGNAIVRCQGCGIFVHQACYGIINVPQGGWVCDACAEMKPLDIGDRCVLCPNNGRRAVKRVRNSDLWVHVACCNWNPEVSFENDLLKRGVILDKINPASRDAKCQICGETYGVCVLCSPECGSWFHNTCAQKPASKRQGYAVNQCPKCHWKLASIFQSSTILQVLENCEDISFNQNRFDGIRTKLNTGAYALNPVRVAILALSESTTSEGLVKSLENVVSCRAMVHEEEWKALQNTIQAICDSTVMKELVRGKHVEKITSLLQEITQGCIETKAATMPHMEGKDPFGRHIEPEIERFKTPARLFIDYKQLFSDFKAAYSEADWLDARKTVEKTLRSAVRQACQGMSEVENDPKKPSPTHSMHERESAGLAESIVAPLRPVQGDGREEYRRCAKVGQSIEENAKFEPCVQGKWNKTPYARREYEVITEYVPAPGLSQEVEEEIITWLKSEKKPECNEDEHCRELARYDLVKETFDTSRPCASRRVGCSQSAIGRRAPLILGEHIEATDTWGLDCYARRNIEAVFTHLCDIQDPGTQTVYISRILMPVVNIQEDSRAHNISCNASTILNAISKTPMLVPESNPSELDDSLFGLESFQIEATLKAKNTQTGVNMGSGSKYYETYVSSVAQTDTTRLVNQTRMILCAVVREFGWNLEDIRVVTSKLLFASMNWPLECFRIHPKGVGVRCAIPNGIKAGTFVTEYLGELYPPWRWFEKQDAIKNAQKKLGFKPILPDFYNIMLERHMDDPAGYDVVFVDPIVRGNFASRLCHSCDPNCATVVMSVDGRFVIALYTLRDLSFGEELTFDYSSVTEEEDEFRAAICLCGTPKCRGSFLYYAGTGAFAEVLNENHTFIERTSMILNASADPGLSESDRILLANHGLKDSVFKGLPDWIEKWAANALRFSEFERQNLYEKFLNLKVKGTEENQYTELGARLEARGILENRRQNIAITINKIRNFLTRPREAKQKKFRGVENPKETPPPLRMLGPREAADVLWNLDDSRVCQAWKEVEKVLCAVDSAMKPSFSNDGAGIFGASDGLSTGVNHEEATEREEEEEFISEPKKKQPKLDRKANMEAVQSFPFGQAELQILKQCKALIDSRKTDPAKTLDEAKHRMRRLRKHFWDIARIQKRRESEARIFKFDAAGDVLTWMINTDYYFTHTASIGLRSPEIQIRKVDIGMDGSVASSQGSSKDDSRNLAPRGGFRIRLKRGKKRNRESEPPLPDSLQFEESDPMFSSMQDARRHSQANSDREGNNYHVETWTMCPPKKQNMDETIPSTLDWFEHVPARPVIEEEEEEGSNDVNMKRKMLPARFMMYDCNPKWFRVLYFHSTTYAGLGDYFTMSTGEEGDAYQTDTDGVIVSMAKLPGMDPFHIFEPVEPNAHNVHCVRHGSSTEAPSGWKLLYRFYAFNAHDVIVATEKVLARRLPSIFDAQTPQTMEFYAFPKRIWPRVEFLRQVDRETEREKRKSKVNALAVCYKERKKYQPGYLWGQLSGWFKQTVSDPSASLSAERRGTISLPDLSSCFVQLSKYKDRAQIMHRVLTKPDALWPTGTHWKFSNKHKVYGSPWFDRAHDNSSRNLEIAMDEMVHYSSACLKELEVLNKKSKKRSPALEAFLEKHQRHRRNKTSTHNSSIYQAPPTFDTDVSSASITKPPDLRYDQDGEHALSFHQSLSFMEPPPFPHIPDQHSTAETLEQNSANHLLSLSSSSSSSLPRAHRP